VAKHEKKRPTDGELEILRVLWDCGPSTVREVFRVLSESRETGYTTVLKLMQIMTEKGSLDRDESVRPQIYRATRSERQTQRQLLTDLVNRAFSGSPGNLVLQALSSKKPTAAEREQIRALLDKQEGASR
jgi:BlaI family penicillinase repressor